MRRRDLANILSNSEQSLPNVWAWYEFQHALIGEERSRTFDALTSGGNLPPSRYIGQTRKELEDLFDNQTGELGLMAMLGMLVCTEATLRVDFIERVREKKKDAMSRAFFAIFQKRGINRIRLDEDILDTWTDCGARSGISTAMAELKGAFHFRHWLAHGRFWRPKLGRADGYDPIEVFEICRQALEAVDLMPTK